MARPNPSRRLEIRLRQVFDALRDGGHANANSLAQHLEASPRTIKRDIEILRHHYQIEIAYDAQRHTYQLANPHQPFPAARFTESELLALFVARQALTAYEGSALGQILADGFHRLERRLDEEQTFLLGDLAGLISFHARAPEDFGAELFRSLTEALRGRFEVSFEYQGLEDKAARLRRVHPYHLQNRDQKWYLHAWDTERQAFRTFALSRMAHLTVGKRRFRADKEYDPAAHFEGAFAAHSGTPGTEFTVLIRFDAWATRLVQERRWHASQEIRPDPAGDGILVQFRLSGLAEVRRWILSWGEHATVLHPPELQADILDAARAIQSSTQAAMNHARSE